MTAFFDGYPPLPAHVGVIGGPERRTDIVALANGHETRNAAQAHARRRYDIAGAFRTLDDMHALLAFFEARRGRWQAFRFRDFADWKSCAPSKAPNMLDQKLGVGDGEEVRFALVKLYGDEAEGYRRPIVKPVAGSVVAAVDGALVSAAADGSGVLTFSSAPPVGAVVSAGFAFDTPVRFDIDRLALEMDALGAARIASAPLIEVRL